MLRHHVRSTGVQRAHVDDACDVLVPELHGEPRTPQEARRGLRVKARIGEHQLQRDTLTQLQMLCFDREARRTSPVHALDAVLSEQHVARAQLHTPRREQLTRGSQPSTALFARFGLLVLNQFFVQHELVLRHGLLVTRKALHGAQNIHTGFRISKQRSVDWRGITVSV